MNHTEAPGSDAEAVEVGGDGAVVVSDRGVARAWSFRSVLGPEATQMDVFDNSGLGEAVRGTGSGLSSCVLCHGATGSGKTHTMLGRPGSLSSLPRLAGLLPRALSGLMGRREAVEAGGGSQTLLLSAVDVYQEAVYDLLERGAPRLAVRQQAESGAFYAAGAAWRSLAADEDAEAAVATAVRQRVTGEHAMNDQSSRSHAVFTVMVVTRPGGGAPPTRAVLVLVDLAGSERRKRTEAAGRMADESSAINTSLLALNRCVMALAAGEADAVVPYRSSVLTKLLRSVLSGPGRVVLVACVSPAESQLDHSVATLQYAARATGIRARPAAAPPPAESAHGAAAELRRARRELADLRVENAALRRQLLQAGIEPVVPPSAPSLGDTALAGSHASPAGGTGSDDEATSGLFAPEPRAGAAAVAQPLRRDGGFVPAEAGMTAEPTGGQVAAPAVRRAVTASSSRAASSGPEGRGRPGERAPQTAAGRPRQRPSRQQVAEELGRRVRREAQLLAVDVEAATHARKSSAACGEPGGRETASPGRRPQQASVGMPARQHREGREAGPGRQSRIPRRRPAQGGSKPVQASSLFDHPGGAAE